jgi:hypothetical protein
MCEEAAAWSRPGGVGAGGGFTELIATAASRRPRSLGDSGGGGGVARFARSIAAACACAAGGMGGGGGGGGLGAADNPGGLEAARSR